MSLLRGTFGWVLIVSFVGVAQAALESTLQPLRSPELAVTVFPVSVPTSVPAGPAGRLQLTVHGADHPGIVSAMTRVIADRGGNITDLSTRLAGGLYVIVAEFELPDEADVSSLDAQLRQVAGSVGVTAHLAPVDSDVL